jgi:hypothetical protein
MGNNEGLTPEGRPNGLLLLAMMGIGGLDWDTEIGK